MALFGRLLHKLNKSAEELRAENLREWAQSLGGVTPISEVKSREPCRVAGVIQNIRIDPLSGTGSVEATIDDGTGKMVARWLGRASLSGVRLGNGLIMSGTPGVGEHGELVILNPDYELYPGPEHG
jgi:hypothetical protein